MNTTNNEIEHLLWFQKPFAFNGVNPHPVYFAKDFQILRQDTQKIFPNPKSDNNSTSRHDFLSLQVPEYKRKYQRKRYSNACFEHRQRHTKCPLDCPGRKKDRDLFMASVVPKLQATVAPDDSELARCLRLLVAKFINFEMPQRPPQAPMVK